MKMRSPSLALSLGLSAWMMACSSGPSPDLSPQASANIDARSDATGHTSSALDWNESAPARELTYGVRRRIASDSSLSDVARQQLRVRASDGVVKLTGLVQSETERTAVLSTVSQVDGVKAIEDNLTLDAP